MRLACTLCLMISLSSIGSLANAKDSGVAANPPTPEYSCSGIVTSGSNTFHDQLVLKPISNDNAKITGLSGAASTFEGTQPYRICINTDDQMTLEYTPVGQSCGSRDASRFGTLQKTAGTLKLSRIDQDVAVSGVYACHPIRRAGK